jgi:hypothetical protein
VHRFVAKAFIPNPKKLPEVNHIDGNKKNNSVLNLQWCTGKENLIHAIENKLNPIQVLDKHQVLEIRELAGKMSQKLLAEKFKVTQVTINRIINRKRWKHI